MDNNILTRLRDWSMRLYPSKYGATMEEAADEIERLQTELRLSKTKYICDCSHCQGHEPKESF